MTPTEAFFQVYEGLPRQGPGDRASLDRALAPLTLPINAAILDAGAGIGADIAGLLDHAPQGTVDAVDPHAPFVTAIQERYADDPRVSAEAVGMEQKSGPYDLIWSAGAFYFLGLEKGLPWAHSALKPGGAFVFSEPCYFTDAPSDAARAFWAEESATIRPQGEILEAVANAGFDIRLSFPLPDAAWEAFYGPMEARIAALRPGAPDVLVEVLDRSQAEVAGWRAAQAETGYLSITAVRG